MGDPVAFVVAETLLQAKDAAEAVEVAIDRSLPLSGRRRRRDRERRFCTRRRSGNVALDYHFGDSEQVAAAFAKAAHVTTPQADQQPRGGQRHGAARCGRRHEPASGRFTLHALAGSVRTARPTWLILQVEPKQVRILTGHVGGSFGMKSAPFPEYVCVLHAARALGRPVKWTDERSGSFVSDSHGRDHRLTAELALDADGSFLAVRITNYGNMGGFLSQVAPMPSTLNTVKNVQGVYRTPLIEVSTKCVFTNTRTSRPIAVPAGRRATTTWSA